MVALKLITKAQRSRHNKSERGILNRNFVNFLSSRVSHSGGHYWDYHLITHWGRLTHLSVSKLTTIGSDNGLSPGRHQAIIWPNAGILLIEPLETNFSGILIKTHKFSFKKMRLKMSSGKWRPFCLGLSVLSQVTHYTVVLSLPLWRQAIDSLNQWWLISSRTLMNKSFMTNRVHVEGDLTKYVQDTWILGAVKTSSVCV